MGLIGNYTFAHKSPARRMAGTGAGLRSGFNDPGRSRGMFAGEAAISKLSAIPRGYTPGGGAWIPPYTFGDLSSVNEGDFAMTGGSLILAAGRNLAGETTVTVTAPDSDLQLVVSATGEATITWSGSGALAGALSATGGASVTFTAGPALLGAIADLTATGSVTLTGAAAATAIGSLAGDITPFAELSPESLAGAMWSALAAQYNTPGTMGEKLNGAGSAGNPWTEVIEGSYTAADVLRIVAAALAGKTSGQPGAPVFRSIDDSADRIAATVDASGNRTAVSLDP